MRESPIGRKSGASWDSTVLFRFLFATLREASLVPPFMAW